MTAISLTPAPLTFAATFVGVGVDSAAWLHSQSDYKWLYTITVPAGFTTTASLTGTLRPRQLLQIPLRCTPTAQGATTGTLTVDFTPGYTDRDLMGPYGTRLPAPATPTAVIAALSCNARQNLPTWQDAAFSAIDYSYVVCGSPLDQLPLMVNPGTQGVCTVTSVTVTGTAFTLEGTPATEIADGGSASFTVRFLPATGQGSAQRSYTGQLRVAWTRGATSGVLEVPLSGIGLEPQDTEESAGGTVADSTLGGAGDGTYRRATVHVPTHDSYLSLGHAYVRDTTTFTQHGFNASTTRNVFTRAAKSTTFQATGQVWFQSAEDALYALSVTGATLVGTNGLYLGGSGNLTVMGGFGAVGDPADVRNASDDDPVRPSPTSSIPTAFLAADLIWEITDKLFLIFAMAKTIERAKHLTQSLKEKYKELTVIGAAAVSAATIGGLVGYVLGKATGSPSGNLNFYSQAGILAGTPAFCSMYGAFGVNYRSANITLLGNIAVTVSALGATTLDSLYGNTAVSAGTKLNVESWLGTFLYCTQASSKFYGTEIQLGGIEPDGLQLPTTTMTISALQKVALTTTLGGEISLAATNPLMAGKLQVDALKQVAITSGLVTSIEVARKWKILANGRGIEIKGAKGTMLKLSAAGVEIGTAAGQLKIAPALADIGGALKVSPASITVMGMADLL